MFLESLDIERKEGLELDCVPERVSEKHYQTKKVFIIVVAKHY